MISDGCKGYKNYQQVYTDGSKEDSKVGCAVISDNHSNMQRIPDVENVKQLFQDIHIASILTFLRQLNLFNKI